MTATIEAQPDVALPAPANLHALILVSCAKASLGIDVSESLARLTASPAVQWDDLIAEAHDHGTLPLLHRALVRCNAAGVPAVLKDRAACNAHRNLKLVGQLLRIIAAMRNSGVRVLPYKGPLLAMSVYGDPSLRQCGDLDIIVPEPDLVGARAALEACGYRAAGSDEVADNPDNATAREYHLTYTNHDAGVMVELHWEVVGRMFSTRIDPADLWNRSRTVAIAGTPVQMLSMS